jgi:hypothetical protein
MVARIWIAAWCGCAAAAATPEWVSRSNEHARVLLELDARFSPEGAGRLGVEGVDEKIADLGPGVTQRVQQAFRDAAETLRRRLKAEQDPKVRQDLEILIRAAELRVRSTAVTEGRLLPYGDVTQLVFQGLRSLLDDQVPEARRRAALVRLRRYTGLEQGYTPIAQLAEERIREKLPRKQLLGPVRSRVEQDLANAKLFTDGIEPLFRKHQIGGYEEALARWKEQVGTWQAFVRQEVLPRARTDFRLPRELYRIRLEDYGVDIEPEELAKRAHAAFDEIQREMQTVAAVVARERGWKTEDYRDVIRELKKEQIVGDAILPHYQKRLAEIEAIVRRENLVTLPDRAARIRLATSAETAAQPAPHMRPPRLVGNQGEMGEFVLPLNIPNAEGKMQGYDDFTFAAASWTLAAHELRPGHEMQFASLVEKGVSAARAIYAFNSANVEGWGLYSEWMMLPHMPAEGRLLSLQARLMRAARAFLDPELQMGKITPEQAAQVLSRDVVLSDAMTRQEVERYTFRAPGQATSYFYGFLRLLEIREEVAKKLGKAFQPKQFHDFVLAQGLIPPQLLRKAALAELR